MDAFSNIHTSILSFYKTLTRCIQNLFGFKIVYFHYERKSIVCAVMG